MDEQHIPVMPEFFREPRKALRMSELDETSKASQCAVLEDPKSTIRHDARLVFKATLSELKEIGREKVSHGS